MGARNTYRIWTDAEIEVARRRDLTDRDVAAMTSRSESSVATRRSRMGVKPDGARYRIWIVRDVELLADYTLSPKQIADATGHPLGSVYAKRKELGLSSPSQMHREAREAAERTSSRAEEQSYTLKR